VRLTVGVEPSIDRCASPIRRYEGAAVSTEPVTGFRPSLS